MTPRGIARVGLLASGLVITSLVVSTPDIARSDVIAASSDANGAIVTSTGGTTVTGGHGDSVRPLGCDKFSKPACNKPGRRSSRR